MRLVIPEGPFKALIFDCDGTLADSMPLHFKAWQAALEPWGCVFTENLHYAWAGRPTEKIVSMLNELQGLKMPPAEVSEAKELSYFELLPEVRPVAEVIEQVRLHAGKLPMAVASGSPRHAVVKTLAALGIAECFETLVCAEDYAQGKPAPDCFLEAARRLGVEPACCLVYEDADLGIEAAQAAGMRWVRVDPRLP